MMTERVLRALELLMGNDTRQTRHARAALALAGCLVLATGLMFWSGYRATQEWRRSSIASVQSRGNELLGLLTLALERDMRGGLTTVLSPFHVPLLNASSRSDLAQIFGSAFVRFPYIESCFVWKPANPHTSSTYFFIRADRPPEWDVGSDHEEVYPVLTRFDPSPVRHVVELARQHASRSVRYAIFESAIGSTRYQTYVQLTYGERSAGHLTSVVGFMVNMDWIRENYFRDFVRHVQDFTGDTTLAIEIRDERGQLVARSGPDRARRRLSAKAFSMLFADPALLPHLTVAETVPTWTAQIDVANEESTVAAERAAARTIAVLAVGAIATVVALFWTVRAARRAAALAAMQTEFVSAMGHEMKTPVSLISLASDTLANQRITEPGTVREYGQLLSREAGHLARLVENVLCYARLQNLSDPTEFESADVAELIEESLEHFRPNLTRRGFNVHLQLPDEPLQVFAHRLMMIHAFDNLVDNAIKHGGSGRQLSVRGYSAGDAVIVELGDKGNGIPGDELPRVFEKFYRGKHSKTPGSGLGLAIVQRIVVEHGGSVAIDSTPGAGTSVTVRLPAERSERS
jgi:signal transduction histidine kinase